MGFTALDYGVLFAYLIGSAIFGTLIGRGQKNINDYFLAGKRMPWWAISFSIVATETSTLTFIGAPAIAYTGNLTFLQVVIGYFFGRILVSFFLIPSYFKGEIHTAYELLNFRFGGKVRNFSAFLFQASRALADGVRLFATALVLSVVSDISDIWTVIIIGVVTIVYTFYGGMRAVVWNDVIQLIIYLAGAFLAFTIILERIPGGWPEVTSLAAPGHKFQFLDFSTSFDLAYTFWAGLLGGAFLTFATHGTDQMMVQRYLACGSKRGSQAAVILSGVVVFFQFFLFLVIGVMLYAFYQHFPLGRELAQSDRIFPIFIVEQMPAGVSGLIIAAIFAAAMSTLSSSLNSLASSSVNDFYKNYLVPEAPQDHYLKVSRMFTLAWGVILISISMLARNWGEVLEVGLTITSITMGTILGVFLLGIWTTRIREGAALAGMVAGLITMLAVHLSDAVAWTWYVLIGTAVTVVIGTAVTWAVGRLFSADN
ncbi:sodium:solute symporter [Acidobacteria bacterium AH-259-L09]|nr:sodium:solute symporter [Acidobacteria bacterium AH-259-L09]